MSGGILVIVGIIVIVMIHETGHFLAARRVGMKATEFFFGFGPRLWSTRRGETEYGIKALPLGGYVRIAGMSPLEEIAPEDEGRTYQDKPFWAKSLVVLAGSATHFPLAFLLFYLVASGIGLPARTTTVESVQATLDDGSATPAAAAGLLPGDTVTLPGGRSHPGVGRPGGRRSRRGPGRRWPWGWSATGGPLVLEVDPGGGGRRRRREARLPGHRPRDPHRTGGAGRRPGRGRGCPRRRRGGQRARALGAGGRGPSPSGRGLRRQRRRRGRQPPGEPGRPGRDRRRPRAGLRPAAGGLRGGLRRRAQRHAAVPPRRGALRRGPLREAAGAEGRRAQADAGGGGGRGLPGDHRPARHLPRHLPPLSISDDLPAPPHPPSLPGERPGGGRRAGHGAVDDDHQDRRRRGHGGPGLRPAGGRGRHRAGHLQRRGRRPGDGRDRGALARADRGRHPLPVPPGPRRPRGRGRRAAAEPGQHPQPRAHPGGGRRRRGPQGADPGGGQRRLARPRPPRPLRRAGARGPGGVRPCTRSASSRRPGATTSRSR